MLLPGTSKFTASHLGIAYVLKQRNGTVPPNNPRLAVHPAVILDYRCYVANGTIGRELPPRVGKCLASMGRMSPQQLMQRYGLPDEETAGALKTRAEGEARQCWPCTRDLDIPLAMLTRMMHPASCSAPPCSSSTSCVVPLLAVSLWVQMPACKP
jgi:hypothetical protein